MHGISLDVAALVSIALRMPCAYPRDDCDKHLREEGFTRCEACCIRDLATIVDRNMPRPAQSQP